MGEFEEFAFALLDQISVEINEEKEIQESLYKATEVFGSKLMFDDIQTVCDNLYSDISNSVRSFTGLPVSSETKVEFPHLVEFKRLKGRKVYPTKDSAEFVDELFSALAHENVEKIAILAEKQVSRYLVYSTYAKSYISQI